MKRVLTILIAILFAGIVSGQVLQKGALVGLHKIEPELASGVTMSQYNSFLKDELIPAYEKSYPGLKCYLMKSKRGECKECTLIIFFFQDEATRDKYFAPDGDYTQQGLEGKKKMQPVLDKLERLDKSKEVYTDYIIE
jgi:hypothetical protein